MMTFNYAVWGLIFVITAFKFVRSIRMVPNRREYIVERLGRYHATLGPGFHILVPFVDRVVNIVDLREESIDVPPQECFTADNVQVEVDGVIYISVADSSASTYGVTSYRMAAVSLAQTTTRSVIGTLDLDRTFEEREAINSRVMTVLSEVSTSWGIRVHRYEVKNIATPTTVREAMERQMGAERQRRAVIAHSEGQKQARINDSEGQKTEMINHSLGERQRRRNEAEGRAREILALAEARAHSIRQMAGVLNDDGGEAAVRLNLGEKWLDVIGKISKDKTSVILPADLMNPDALLAAVELEPSQTP